jgi:hypothetical protein
MTTALTFNADRRSRVDLVPRDDPKEAGDPTEEKVDPDALPREKLEDFIRETRNEPPWRKGSDMDAEYYDGNQLRQDTLAEMAEKGIPPIITNLVQPIVNTALGMEAKTRSDWQVTADDKPSEQVAQRLNQDLNEAERESNADRAISEAYGGQLKGGLGWVEVGVETDPFRYKYRVQSISRREIWWDWRARHLDLSDARYLIRRRWFDADVLEKMLPRMKSLIQHSVNSWSGFSGFGLVESSIDLARSYEEQRATSLEQYEWLDTGRKRCQVYEVWYRHWVRGFIFRLPNDKVIEVDRKNPRHQEMIASGFLAPIPAVFPKMRVSMWLGPHRLTDRPSPLPHRDFPYVPFWGYREDLTGAPYGIIRALRSPQDETNARRSKLLSLITGRRMVIDDDAASKTWNTIEDIADEVSNADAVVVLNANRKNKDGFRVESNGDLAAGQMKALEDHKNEMHQVSGIFPPAIGDPGQGLSGVAIDNLVDQSTTVLAEINDNYRFGRRKVGELLLAHVRQDLMHPHEAVVGKGRNAKPVYFNRSYFDPEINAQVVENSIADANIKVTLSDIPSTATYRRQQFAALAELTKGLPPEVQVQVIDFVIEASDVKDRDKIADRLRRALGIPDPEAGDEGGNDPAQAKIEALMQEHQQIVAELMSKLQPAMAEIERLKIQLTDRQAELALEAEKERNRKAEAERELQLKAAEIEQKGTLELEKSDLEHERLAHTERQSTADREFQREQAAMQPAPVEDDKTKEIEGAISTAIEDVRDMIKALADELAKNAKEVSDLKKTAEKAGDDKKQQPEPVKAEDIAKALTQALAPVLQQPKAEPAKPAGKRSYKVLRDEKGVLQGVEGGESAAKRRFKVLRDEKGAMQGVEEE